MTKSELENKIRSTARNIASQANKPENATPMSLKYSEILFKFPKLQEILSDLMSDEFTSFITDIDWIAPRPTTFKIILKNQNFFYLIWNINDFIARIAGTNYILSAVSENERAIKAIQELLITGPINPDKELNSQLSNSSEEDELVKKNPEEI